ncbi:MULTISPECIES: hypothetical protein [Siminovitchia]|uniref:Plasmid segregation centromere-binding protein ParR n=1 Tax=Siminovitchia sediminis TaxID=1274353 RepID=A0ABW4KHT6_9BACI|nr:hypothetical protein [Siminovitchia fortis]
MALVRRIFSYDDIEDKVIHDFLESIPERQRSRHIRMAIRLYINETRGSGNIPTSSNQNISSNTKKDHETKPKTVEQKEKTSDEFIDLDQDFLDDLGK